MDIEQYIVDFKYNDELLENFKKHLNKDANAILKAVYGEDYDNYCDGLMQNLRALLEKFFEEGSNTQESKPKFTAKNFIDFSNKFADEAKFEKVELNGNKDWATENNAVKAVKVLLVQLLSLPESASSYFNLGDRLNNLMSDDGKSAILIFELSTIKYPERNWPFYKLGKLLIKISNNKEKLKKLQQILISSEAGGIGDKKQVSGYANIQAVKKQIDDNLKEDKIPLPFLTNINNKDEYTPEFKDAVNTYLSKANISDISSDIKETNTTVLFKDAALFELADSLSNKDDNDNIIKDAFRLVYLVSLFRAKQFAPKDSTTYYQYTGENTLKSIMSLDEPNNLEKPQIKVRLYNILGMNDPFEGKYSYNLLDYNPIESNTFMPSNTYIASFIKGKKESLAMWKMYGDDFKGVRLGFTFIENTSDTPDSDKEIFPELYQVVYFDEATISEVTKACPKSAALHEIVASNESKNEVIFAEIKKVVSNLTEKITSAEKTIADKLTVLIDQQLEKIRYLIKDSIYKSEYEYRLLVRIDSAIIKDEVAGAKAAKEVNDIQKYSEKPVLHFDKGNPKLYYEFEDVELASIIFGTSFNKAYQWIPFLSIKVPELMATNQITSSELEGRYR
ncbi:DUF2971 domain-containing protein [Periweissella fabalis]|uniref:DUF2971 domain-containing protein n=1 Tax=Periweissella fabalis TaxID=1070421 RepID=A0A7X6S2B3_9LACO|nr:DUF2971 domain-containing protein [Periweissella fabalis]MCM0599505.1 DUF2971 domain-containing protein [Periweissella fabalis]NKZ23810.1 DUF2971 domain-containing protein [Periweissella fabalis]